MKYTPQVGDWFFAEHRNGPRYYGQWKAIGETFCFARFSHTKDLDDRPAVPYDGGFCLSDYSFTKLPAPHNPKRLSSPGKGYRFLDEDEIHRGPSLSEIEVLTASGCWDVGFEGCLPQQTYRTKLTRTQLRNLRNPTQPMKQFHVSFNSGQLTLLAAYCAIVAAFAQSREVK